MKIRAAIGRLCGVIGAVLVISFSFVLFEHNETKHEEELLQRYLADLSVGNPYTHTLHLQYADCPISLAAVPDGELEKFHTIDEAKASDYKLCPFCFGPAEH